MPRPTNRQYRSVGNLGDILKHAALVELASLLAETRSSVCWVETHTFLLHAALADPERWNREIDALVAEHPAYARYAAIERAALSRSNRYRCSSGLVIDVLGDRRTTAVLAEANAVTRGELASQLRDEGLANVFVVDDASAIDREPRVPSGGAVLVHVDPFALSAETWSSIAPPLDAICSRASEVVLVAYRYTRMAPSPWPTAPNEMLGPLAQIRGGPHEIAVYGSSGVASEVRRVCSTLGWRLEPR